MENNQKLAESLKINSPTFYSLSDSVLNISRFNKVELDWNGLVENSDTQSFLRNYFLKNFFTEVDGETVLTDYQGKGKFWDFFPYVDKDGVTKELFCIILKYPQRHYVVGIKDKYLEKSDIERFLNDSIDDLWKEFEEKDYDYFLTYLDSKTIINTLTFDKNPHKDLVSRELLFYKEKFEHLSAKLGFIQQVNEKINSDFTPNILADQEKLEKLFGDSELLSFYLSNYSRINLIKLELKKEIDVIQNKLFEKGYYLETEKCINCERTKWGLNFKSNYGEIYSLVNTDVDHEIIEYVDKEVPDYSGPNRPYGRGTDGKPIGIANGEAAWEYEGTRTKIVKETVKRLVKKKEDQIKSVQIKDDPIYEKIFELKERGYWVHVFENRDGSYFSNNGSLLSEIIDDCESFEGKRVNTVIVIKEYDLVDLTNKAVIGAAFYYHPMRGVTPSKTPTIGIRETLDYRMSWAGLEIGKLIDSICLAPGETKTVSISNRFSSVNSTSTSSKTFNEINSVNSNEFSTEFEKLVTNELERVKESSSGANAKFSYMGFGAGGDSKQSSKETIKDFTKNLNKSTTKATNTLSKKASVELNFSSTNTVESSLSSTRNSTISNINQGRTLNLYYYQLNNRFMSRVYLENLRLEISSSFELIEGSGIYDTFVIKLTDIEQVIHLVKQFVPNFKVGEESKIVESAILTLNEYTDTPLLVEDEDDKALVKLNSLEIIEIQPQFAEKINNLLIYEELLKSYKRLISSIQFENLFFNEKRFIIDSGSYYLDSQVGVNPATEEYSETMRRLESFKIEAEIERQNALNAEIKAKVKVLQKEELYISDIFSYTKESVANNGEEELTPNNFSILSISKQIADSNYGIYLKNQLLEHCTVTLANEGKSLIIQWNSEIPEKRLLENDLILIHTDGHILRFI